MSLIIIAGVVAALATTAYGARARILNALTSRSGYTLQRDLSYGPETRQKLDLYRPEADAANAPLIVFFYGGNWSDGSRDFYRFVAQPFASRGFIVAIPDYRLFPEVTFPAFVEDGARAVAYLWRSERKPDGSPRQIILMGHSAGAQIAALLALDEHYLREAGLPAHAVVATVGMSGPYDFLPLTEARYEAVFPEATRASSQPIAFADGREAPMLVMTGDADRTVSPGNSRRLAARIKMKGGEVTLKTYPGVGHLGMILTLAAVIPFGKPPALDDILAFLAAHTGKGATSRSDSG